MLNLNKTNRNILLCSIVWLLITAVLLGYFQASQLKVFDPKQQLQTSSWLTLFKQQVNYKATQQHTLLLISDKNCGCAKRAASHISALQGLAAQNNMVFRQLTVTAALADIIPATPAAIVLTQHGELAYAGPLSQGLACAQGSGFVETVLNNLQQGFNSRLIVSDTLGCYCS